MKDIPKEELMNTVSFVFQNSRLIKASILENVRMGKPEATREEVLAALHHAQCDDILEKLPQGVDTVIGTKGVYLSGGEQQRIAIARVMLKMHRSSFWMKPLPLLTRITKAAYRLLSQDFPRERP